MPYYNIHLPVIYKALFFLRPMNQLLMYFDCSKNSSISSLINSELPIDLDATTTLTLDKECAMLTIHVGNNKKDNILEYCFDLIIDIAKSK